MSVSPERYLAMGLKAEEAGHYFDALRSYRAAYDACSLEEIDYNII